jgi:hypothetical protein
MGRQSSAVAVSMYPSVAKPERNGAIGASRSNQGRRRLGCSRRAESRLELPHGSADPGRTQCGLRNRRRIFGTST